MYFSVEKFEYLGFDDFLLTLDDDGIVEWSPGGVFKTVCSIKVAKYPFDTQHCAINFNSWAYNKDEISFISSSNTIYLDEYSTSGQWIITSTKAHVQHVKLIFQTEEESLVVFSLTLKRMRTFFVITIVFPVMLLSVLNIFVFLLPAESGEKVSLSVTILLSFTVLLTLINDDMPKTSDDIAFLGKQLHTRKLYCLILR